VNGERERELWQVYCQTGDQTVRQQLIEAYIPLVTYIAERLSLFLPPTIEHEDLLGYGAVGLIEAVNRFNPGRNIKFSTFAAARIRGAMLDGLRKADWVPRGLRKKEQFFQEAYYKLANCLGRTPTDPEMAKELGISEQELHRLRQEISMGLMLSLEGNSTQGEEQDFNVEHYDRVDFHTEALQQILRQEKKQILVEAMENLSEKERLVIGLYYYEGLTIKEIAAVLNLSVSRISQLHSKSIVRLRGYLSRKKNELLGN
jgi:RNA polymerase sigma factor for flagellar operon FliA